MKVAEQSRARYPDAEGDVDSQGIPIHWERYGDGAPAILFQPAWSIIHSRCWKAQIPYFARHHRVITFDPRGNGRSGRPIERAGYAESAFAEDAVKVLDASETHRAVVVGLSRGAQRGLILAARQPDRVAGLVLIAPSVPLAPMPPHRADAFARFHEERKDDRPWHQYNAHYWRRDFPAFLEYFFSQAFSEPHSTKQIEDCVGWGLECGADALIASEDGAGLADATAATAAAVLCPLLVIHGADDALVSHAAGVELARITGGTLATIEGGGHCPQARDPVLVNRLIRDFVDSLEAGDAT